MIDETSYGEAKKEINKKIGIRSAVMCSLTAGVFLYEWPAHQVGRCKSKRTGVVHRIRSLGWLLRYGMQNGMCGNKKVRPIVDVSKLVEQWIGAIVGMCTCHDKDAYDAHDAKADELLGPLLTAPVKQVREFYHALAAKMKEDKRVPMLVWMGFEAWGEVIVKDAPDEGIKRLKKKLAGEIADLVEEDIKDQIPKAIKRALQWRDPEVLKEIKQKLEKGVKPKLRGRESCLFLEAGRGKKKTSVML